MTSTKNIRAINFLLFKALLLNVLLTNAVHVGNNYQTTQGSHSRASENKLQSNNQAINQRNSRQGHSPKSNGSPVVSQQPAEHSYQYRPFAAAPDHIKQLIYQAYSPQQPYVNPHAFFYNINPTITYQDSSSKKSIIDRQSDVSNAAEEPSKPASNDYYTAYKPVSPQARQTIARLNKIPKQGGIKYKNDVAPSRDSLQNHRNYYSQQEQVKRSPEINSPIAKYSNHFEEQREEEAEKNQEQLDNDRHYMPGPIKQLLQYQAQIPYNVLANHIIFQSQKPFIPKPLSAEIIDQSSSNYPHQIFYIKSDGQVFNDRNEEMIYNKE
ncbi:hypothetical protein PV325_010516 [Microctonus aethiopoides]|uniref:Uncharacterized protein n=1 Tax=Microctonus aethiopoides TaxID=144406 RepID=A0AA39FJY0_9HYME|nr:hypothetical protein PV325_010516 [Microctonus aethiopoides]KAK0170984.1 hypothetical protein PV328_008758 [Microctonus aethiopoides]